MGKLKECPFCGGKAEVRDVHYTMKTWTLQDRSWIEKEVACVVCGAKSKHFKAEEDTVNAWNRRADNAGK